MSYGKAIRVARKQKNMTQEQLTNQMYVSKQAVSQWEHERSFPDLEKAYQLLEILDMRVAFEELVCSSNDEMYAIPVDRVFCHLPEIENLAKQAGKQPTEIRLSKYAFLLFKHLKSWNPDYQVSDLDRNFLVPYCKSYPKKEQSTYYIVFNGDDAMYTKKNQNNGNINPVYSSNPNKGTIENPKVDSNNCPMIWSQDVRGDRNKNVLVMGDSGTGKSRYVIKPNLLQMDGSYVITDPCGEYLADTGTMFERNGYKIRVLNLMDTRYSHHYDPIHYCKSEYDVNRLTDCIIANTSGFPGASKDEKLEKILISACILYHPNYHLTAEADITNQYDFKRKQHE